MGVFAAISAARIENGHVVVNISQDCFYRNLTAAEREELASYNFDHPTAFDLEETVSAMTRLRQLGAGGRAGAAGVTIPQYARTHSRTRSLTLSLARALTHSSASRAPSCRRYCYLTSSRKPAEESAVIHDADVIIFDGLLVFYWAELRELFAV